MSQEQDYFVNVVNETPIPVTLGSENITINGNVNVLDTVTVNNPENNPVHVHMVESVEVEVKNDVGNPLPVTVQQVTTDWMLDVAKGLVPGQYAETKNGYAGSMSSNTEVTVWNETTAYPWASWTTAQKLYVKSDSASDTGQVIRIEGLDANYNKITEDITTNGTTAVASTQNFLRLNRGYLISGNTNVGIIREHLGSGTGTAVGSMAAGFARNKGGFFTVPHGFTAYILWGECTQFRGGSGNIGGIVKMYTRTGSGPFLNQYMSEVVNGHFRTDFTIPLAIPQNTDIDVRLTADGNGTQATCAWQMLLIPNP
jgi:hypothetical protein